MNKELLKKLEFAMEEGERVAKKYNPEGFNHFPFIKVIKSEEDLDAKIGDLGMDENVVGGFLQYKDGSGFKIFAVDKGDDRDFIIAHELGHYFLHRGEVKTKNPKMILDEREDVVMIIPFSDLENEDNLDDDKIIEAQANYFALSLLMPKDLVKKAWLLNNDIDWCANIFNVSTRLMLKRLQILKLV